MTTKELLEELKEYMENKNDITVDGTPNEEMRLLYLINQKLENLTEND